MRIVAPSRTAARRYDSQRWVFLVDEHRKTRLISDLHNDESNLVVKSFKFDAMQLSVSMVYGCLCPNEKVFSRDMTSDKPLHVVKEINFARFSSQQSLSKYFPFKT